MRQVTKERFWEFIGGATFNVVSTIEGSYPYTSIFKTAGGTTVGKIVGRYTDESESSVAKDYFLCGSAA